jgi:DNA-binding transcriptional regulator YiaG
MRTTRKALEAAGGIQQLAERLRLTLEEVHDWLIGRCVPPDQAFLAMLEIVSRRR